MTSLAQPDANTPENDLMGDNRLAADPATCDAAARCARRCVSIISSLLRPEEVGEAVREFEWAIQEELEAPPGIGIPGLHQPSSDPMMEQSDGETIEEGRTKR